MRDLLRHQHVSRLGWSAAAGAAAGLTARALDASKIAGLVLGVAVCAAMFLALRLYAAVSPL